MNASNEGITALSNEVPDRPKQGPGNHKGVI